MASNGDLTRLSKVIFNLNYDKNIPGFLKIDEMERNNPVNMSSDRSAVPIDSALIGQLPDIALASNESNRIVEGINSKRLVQTG